MKHQGPRHRTLLRATQIAVASAAFALLAACGGGSGGNNNASTPPPSGVSLQVVAFGTSLTDAGTYSEQILPGFGGGRFTTNPGEVWAQKVSEYFGSTLSPAFEGGFGLPLTATGGLDYAQGGALVTGGGVANTSAVIPAASEQPVTWQLQQYLAQHGGFNANQLVLVEGGANEILNLLDNKGAGLTAFGTALAATPFSRLVIDPATQQSTVASLMNAGFTQAQATALVPAAIALQIVTNPAYAASFTSILPVLTAAQTLANLVSTQIAGTPKVAVATVPDIGKTPAALEADASTGATPGSSSSPDQALSLVSAMYNLTLLKEIGPSVAAKKVVVVDVFSWLDQSIQNAASLGFTVTNTDTACNLTQMTTSATNYALANPKATLGLDPATTPQATINAAAQAYGTSFGSALFCSPQTLKAANAPTTYMFADQFHPTTALHAQFATFVETQLAAAGIGKAPQ
ncbi:acylhydrolase [Paraburkholderia sp. JHI2823]|uniref:acylhydrolase n=1 Tax=Paraburkholderia sp. JHI2823 TaxID=3112960 RepID=UPI003181ADC8